MSDSMLECFLLGVLFLIFLVFYLLPEQFINLLSFVLCQGIRSKKSLYTEEKKRCDSSRTTVGKFFRKYPRFYDFPVHDETALWIFPLSTKRLNQTIVNRFDDMNYEKARFRTFQSFPTESPMWITRLAANGFFYSGQHDEVTCFACSAKYSSWKENDNIADVHVRISPNCSFIQGQSFNVPITIPETEQTRRHSIIDDNSDSTEDSLSLLLAKLAETETNRMFSKERVEQPESPGATGGVPICHKESLWIKRSRLETFIGWPAGDIISPERLASAGLYYTGFEDIVCCFSCDGSLLNWEYGDDAFVMHARWFPYCGFLKKEKGSAFIKKHQEVPHYHAGDTDVPSVRSKSNGDSRMYRIGTTVYELQDDSIHEELIDREQTTTGLFPKSSAARENGSSLIPGQQKAKPPNLSCKICKERKVNVLFLPCSHVAVCDICDTSMSECFVCGRAITGKRNIYIS